MLTMDGAFQGAKRPDRERFAEIARQCEAILMRAALRLCKGGHECAQELVQDALVRGYEAFRAGKFREGFSPAAWLTRILTNNFINDYRRKQKWDAGVDVETLTAGGEIGPESTRVQQKDLPEGALLEGTFDEPLEKALNALPEGLRIVVLLVDVEERSYQEAADLLKIPVGTVRSRLSRARYALQEMLKEYAKNRRLA